MLDHRSANVTTFIEGAQAAGLALDAGKALSSVMQVLWGSYYDAPGDLAGHEDYDNVLTSTDRRLPFRWTSVIVSVGDGRRTLGIEIDTNNGRSGIVHM